MDVNGRSYKIKLDNNRILGPLDLERIQLLIQKNQIIGKELAQVLPQGDWQDINQIPEIAELFISKAQGLLEKQRDDIPLAHTESEISASGPNSLATQVVSSDVLQGATEVLQTATEVLQTVALKPLEEKPEVDEFHLATSSSATLELHENLESPSELTTPSVDHSDGKTVVHIQKSELTLGESEDEKTRVAGFELEKSNSHIIAQSPSTEELLKEKGSETIEVEGNNVFDSLNLRKSPKKISEEKTVIFRRSKQSPLEQKKPSRRFLEVFRPIFILAIFGYILNSYFITPEKKQFVKLSPIRPSLPSYIEGKSDPNKSHQIYLEGLKYYLNDNVIGYQNAAEKFKVSAGYDINNVKALAMLASSYLNLIDSSNKDENYFSVLSKLIDMSRAKAVELPETVIADVEFYLVVNKAEAAQNRIVEYTKSHEKFGLEMFYYLALAFFNRGDAMNAARYLSQFPDTKAFSPKIFYLRGQIAEKLNDNDAAMREYKKAVQFNPNHAKSRLRMSVLFKKLGKLKECEKDLNFLVANPQLLDPADLGLAYYLHAQLEELFQKWDIALGDIEKAVKLDNDNHDYLLELYTLRAKAGDSLPELQKQGRMYYFLGEAERKIQAGHYQDAMVPLLQARNANDHSPLPLVKIGDMFNLLHDVENAKHNYRLAADRAPDNIQVWSKYIASLIQSYEWEEASKAMDKFRQLPISQSSIDKAAADMYQKQGRIVEAQMYYKKAMSREVVDRDVYLAYAKSLVSSKNFKDAPFFFALSLRFDPLNFDATIQIAKCVAETESIERAINLLQDELKQGITARAEFLAAIAELNIQKGNWEVAQENIDQAMKANPDYALSWKIQAQIYMNREGLDKNALDKALFAYREYSERNASDPSGYLERYKIFIKKMDFEKAKDELTKIYEVYPKYPNLHYYLGALYSVQGNHRVAAEEFQRELKNNPDNPPVLIATGKELIELSNPSEALTYFTKAMQLNPLSPDAKQNAGWANRFLKNYEAAIALLTGALSLDKGNPMIYKRLGMVYRDVGDYPSACNQFRKYLEMEPDASDKADFKSCF